MTSSDKPIPQSTSSLTLTAIVCAYTEERWEDIVDAVASLRNQSPEPHSIVLVVDHNESLFEACKKEFSDEFVRVTNNVHQRGLSGARNTGVELSNTDIIAFLDDDAAAAPGWCQAIIDAFSDSSVIGIGGKVVPRWRAPRPSWWPTEFDWVVGCSYTGLPVARAEIRNPIGANMAIRTTALDASGLFSPAIGRVGKHPVGCEETELFIRINQTLREAGQTRVLYLPDAVVTHNVPASRANFSYFIRRCFAEGLSKAVVSKLVGSQDGLSSERTYTRKTLPHGVISGIRVGLKGDLNGFRRVGAIIAGLFVTVAGYARGRLDNGTHLRLPQSANGGSQ